MHFTLGESMECLNTITDHDTIIYFLRFNALFFICSVRKCGSTDPRSLGFTSLDMVLSFDTAIGTYACHPKDSNICYE